MSAAVAAAPREPDNRRTVDEWAETIRADFAAAVDRSIAEDRAWWIREEIRTLEEKCEAPLAGRSTSEPKRAADDQIALDRNELAAEATP
jgi:hypothetical protein